MPETAVQRFYRVQARIYDATRWAFLPGRRAAIAALALQPDSRVLELGCGTGLSFRRILSQLDPARGTLTAVDFSPDMLARARRRVARHRWNNVELIRDDVTALQLDQRFDAVLFAYSINMVPDWQAALDRAVAHLAPGGRLALIDFGDFAGWGPGGAALRAWLRANHVETGRPYADELRRRLGNCTFRPHAGGYYFIAAACKPEHPASEPRA
ncbi:MAG: class I SAM-dependent methyltransferase [Planctomycetota bacterium]